MSKLILIATLFMISIPTQAQYQLETMVHTQEESISSAKSSRPDSEIDLLESEGLEQNNVSSVDDVLRMSTSATTARGPRSSGESPQVRGLDTGKIFVMIDGARQNYSSGHNSMIAVDFENLKTVEIYKSSNDLSKGGSLGGGVQFITKDPSDYLKKNKKFGSEFKSQFNSANNESIYNAKAVSKKNDLSQLISLTSANAGDLKLNNDENLENSSYKDISLLTKLVYKKFKFTYEYYQREDNSPLDPTLNPPSSFKSLHADSKITKKRLSFQYKNRDSDITTYLNEFDTDKTRLSDDERTKRKISTLGISINRHIKNWSFGGETYQDVLTSDSSTTTIDSYPKAKSNNASLYTQKNFKRDQVSLDLGIRYSLYTMNPKEQYFADKSANHLSKKAYLSYRPFKPLNLFASYSEGFNAPKVNQVYPSGLHSQGDGFLIRDNYFITNIDLKHETSQIREIGFSFERSLRSSEDLFKLSFSMYENDLKDYIYLKRIDRSIIDDDDGTTQFINLSKAALWGGEIQASYIYDIYDFSLAYTKIRGKNKSLNTYLEDLPADKYTLDIKTYIDKYNLVLGYAGIYTLEQSRVNEDTIQRTEKTGSYYIHNIFANKKFTKNIYADLKVDNLGNKRYKKHASHLYEAKEDIKFSLKYKFNTK